MPKRVAVSTLNASTIDILNVIRANASLEYQNAVPVVETERDIPKVGEVIYGYPAFANQFINALVNRIALVRVRSLTFNNPYASLKKGYLEYGETIEEVFVNIAKARTFNVEKAADREFRRSLPDVRSAFHAMNYRVQYPVTIQDQDLKQAFLSIDGVQELIARIVDSVYRAADYDEYLLFKYMLIKAATHGKLYPVSYDPATLSNSAVEFRSMSNLILFPSTSYNEAGVLTSTPRERQIIFMDARFNARFDVEVLASAFNMNKADFMGRLFLIDSWTTFDNERFSQIQLESDMLPPVTPEELALMKDTTAVIVDEEWFQVYDNHTRFTEKYVAAGEYWNYFYNIWKTISHSPFSNALMVVQNTADTELPASITVEVTDKSVSEEAIVISFAPQEDTPALSSSSFNFVQTQEATQKGIAVHRYGAVIYPPNAEAVPLSLSINGTIYSTAEAVPLTAAVSDTFTFTKTAG